MDNLTNTAHGLHLMRTLVFDPRNRGVGGDRIDVPNVALIITDGASNVDADRTISNNLLLYDENLKKEDWNIVNEIFTWFSLSSLEDADLAKKDGVYLMAVGVTNRVNVRELKGISSTGREGESYWTTADFTVMDSVINAIINQTCAKTAQGLRGNSYLRLMSFLLCIVAMIIHIYLPSCR